MNVAAVIVTRGDVDLTPIFRSLPKLWERVVWDNGAGEVRCLAPGQIGDEEDARWEVGHAEDVAVAGRYRAIAATVRELIYVQDDDCVLDDPRALLRMWSQARRQLGHERFVVTNMPPEFRHDFYAEHALVGFGAMFYRDLPELAFQRWGRRTAQEAGDSPLYAAATDREHFNRTVDVIFTALTSRLLIDTPVTSLPHASAPTRLYRRPEHQGEREATLALAIDALPRPRA